MSHRPSDGGVVFGVLFSIPIWVAIIWVTIMIKG